MDALPTTQLRPYYDVLEDLIQGVAGMYGAVGVGGSIVQDEGLSSIFGESGLTLPLVQIIGAFRAVGLELRSGWSGREVRSRKIQSLAPVYSRSMLR